MTQYLSKDLLALFSTKEQSQVSTTRAHDWIKYLSHIDYVDPKELKERAIKNLLLDKTLDMGLLSKICKQIKDKAKPPTYISFNEDSYLACPVCNEKAAYVIGPAKDVPIGLPKWKFDINPFTIQCPRAHRWNYEPYTGDKVKNGAFSLTGKAWDICWDGSAWVIIKEP